MLKEQVLQVTPKLLEKFLDHLQTQGRSKDTIITYRRSLDKLYRLLPQHSIAAGTLDKLRDKLIEQGYASNTINVYMGAANSFVKFCGRRDLQVGEQLRVSVIAAQEPTREEYLQMLLKARALGKERVYLLMKLMGTMGLTPHQISSITIEQVRRGLLPLSDGYTEIPLSLRQELLAFSRRRQIADGLLFITRSGTPVGRTNMTAAIQAIGKKTDVALEKANPRGIRKMYLSTQAQILHDTSAMIKKANRTLLAQEQEQIGWDITQNA